MKAFVVPNYSKKETAAAVAQLTHLSARFGLELFFLPEDGSALFPDIADSRLNELKNCQVIIAIGGDGTIMHCAKLGAAFDKPLVGINSGKLGFLAQVEPDNLERCLPMLTSGEYTVERRGAISAVFPGSPGIQTLDFALNDIVISKTPDYNLTTFQMSCNGKIIDCYSADGLIFSTSTGSTAYNLSAGGPVVDPLIDVITMVPICPHSFSVRPMVFAQSRVISVHSSDTPLLVVADGQCRRTIEPGTRIEIRAAERTAGFITFREQEFFEILTRKIKQRVG